MLVNMKPRKHDVWTGSIYSRFSGNTYYATMTLLRIAVPSPVMREGSSAG